MSIKSKGGFWYLLPAVPLAIIVITAAWVSLFSDGGLGKAIIKVISKLLEQLPFSNFLCDVAGELWDVSIDVLYKQEILTAEKQFYEIVKNIFKLVAGGIILPYVAIFFGGNGKHSLSIDKILFKLFGVFVFPILISLGTGLIFDEIAKVLGDKLFLILCSASIPIMLIAAVFLILKLSGMGIGWTLSFIGYKICKKTLLNVFINAFLSCVYIVIIVSIYTQDLQLGMFAALLSGLYVVIIWATVYVMDNAKGSWKDRLVWKAGLNGISPHKFGSWLWF